MKTKKHKHLTLSDRNDIQCGLERQESFKAISQLIGKDPTTVAKEVRRNKEDRISTKDAPPCSLLQKAPYVCNGCPRKRINCGYKKTFYYGKRAQQKYENLLVEAREGTPLNRETFWEIDRILSKGIKKGQHVYHILKTNHIGISSATVYRHIRKGYLSVSTLDLPRAVKFKPRKKATLPPILKADKEGRRYEDFLDFLKERDLSSWLEMDTVIGRPGGKVLLTFNVSFCNFIFARLMDSKTAIETAKHIQQIKDDCQAIQLDFSSIFPVILTDNGGEFTRVDDIEMDVNGHSYLFFCDPNRSDQKGRIEKNHTLIRDILPKGASFDQLTQEDINQVLSHVNSVKRQALNGKTAYELFAFTYGEELARALGVEKIPAQEVCQSPKLLNGKI